MSARVLAFRDAQRATRRTAVPAVHEDPVAEVLLVDLLSQIARAALAAIGTGCLAVWILLEGQQSTGLGIAAGLAVAGGLCFLVHFITAGAREEHHADEAVARRLRIDGPPEDAA